MRKKNVSAKILRQGLAWHKFIIVLFNR
jgi:hypothetical protein